MTRYVPHLEMMRRGYLIDLGLDSDNYVPSPITQNFIDRMNQIFKHNDNAFSAGALLAFEGTAIKEFHILDEIIKRFCELDKRKLKEKSLTSLYIIGHKEFEIGHEEHLKIAIKSYINEENISKMVKGYINVCLAMNIWWEQLALESYHSFAQSILTLKASEIEEPSITF